MQIQPSGAAFFKPARGLQTTALYGLGEGDGGSTPYYGPTGGEVLGTVNSLANAASSIIGAIMGSENAKLNQQNVFAQNATQQQGIAAQYGAQQQGTAAQIEMARIAAESRNQMMMVAGGVAALGIAAYIFTR